jgi:arabinose-5-phosphate isomerase
MLTLEQKGLIRRRTHSVLKAEARAIEDIFIQTNFITAVEMLLACPGKIITTGMGKVGHVALRVASTLSSTGTPAVFLHPGEASHGDLGVLAKDDLLIACSNSGKTREVLETVERAKQITAQPLIVVTGDKDSPLAQLANLTLCYGPVQEPCPLGLTPTASIAAMGALLDALTIALMELKGITAEDYLRNHHGGYLSQLAQQKIAQGK